MNAIHSLRTPTISKLVLLLHLSFGCFDVAMAQTRQSGEPEEFGGLDIEQLSRVLIVSATLTPTLVRLVPAQTTELNDVLVRQSGGRNLNEVFEIYAPNAELILHNTHLDHFGMRGIISDREDKYLLRVNGKVMNNRFLVGAESERGLPMMGDLRSVSLVHGPASATYGPGALAGAMNLETYDGLTFSGSDMHVRQGFIDKFSVAEARYGKQFSGDSGVFVYGGLGWRSGADQQHAPYVFGSTFATLGSPTQNVIAGQPVQVPVPNLHDGNDVLKMKFHLSYVSGPMEVWARFTRDGVMVRPDRSTLEETDPAAARLGRGNVDQQFVLAGKYKMKIRPGLDLETFVSYDSYHHRLDVSDASPIPQYRKEDELLGRVLANWTPDSSQSVALGVETTHTWLNGPRLGFPPVEDKWDVNTIALLAEHQMRWNEKWTTFASARLDKHTYTDNLFSPRLALVYTPTPQDTFKWIAAHAVRRTSESELREQFVRSGTTGGATETLGSFEFRYERQHRKNLGFGVSTFVERNKAIGYNQVVERSQPVGTFDLWGFDLEVNYQTDNTRLTLSHGYTKLLNSSLAGPGIVQGISAAPYGFGNDLANWANNITKLALVHKLDDKLTVNSSLRLYWKFPGAKDLADWNGTQANPETIALADPGWEKSYGASVFLNAGLEYRPRKDVTLRADAFNILGLWDKTLNKRIYFFRGSNYSSEAAALAVSANFAF
jgi:iron complex outermembrane receptor protein